MLCYIILRHTNLTTGPTSPCLPTCVSVSRMPTPSMSVGLHVDVRMPVWLHGCVYVVTCWCVKVDACILTCFRMQQVSGYLGTSAARFHRSAKGDSEKGGYISLISDRNVNIKCLCNGWIPLFESPFWGPLLPCSLKYIGGLCLVVCLEAPKGTLYIHT